MIRKQGMPYALHFSIIAYRYTKFFVDVKFYPFRVDIKAKFQNTFDFKVIRKRFVYTRRNSCRERRPLTHEAKSN